MNSVKRNLTSQVKNKIYSAIANGESSKHIRETYKISPAQLVYYKKTLANWNPTDDSEDLRLTPERIDNKNPLVKDLVSSINDLKREKKYEIENGIANKNSNTISSNDNNDEDNKCLENLKLQDENFSPYKNPGEYLKFTIDGIELLIRKNTKKIIIENDNVYIMRG